MFYQGNMGHSREIPSVPGNTRSCFTKVIWVIPEIFRVLREIQVHVLPRYLKYWAFQRDSECSGKYKIMFYQGNMVIPEGFRVLQEIQDHALSQ
jgi:hypothetical protein